MDQMVGVTEIAERMGRAVSAAGCTTQAAWAALLADRDRPDDRTRATAMAAQAKDTAFRGGYRNIERNAADLFERLG